MEELIKAVKPTLSAKEVEKLYGISTKRLELMRAESRGPAYVQLSERGTVMYQKDELERWIDLFTAAQSTGAFTEVQEEAAALHAPKHTTPDSDSVPRKRACQ